MPDTRLDSSNLSTAGGLKYTQMEAHPRFSFTRDSTEATEQYLMNSSDVMAFVDESNPLPFVDKDGVVHLPPRRAMPGTNFMFTQSIEAEPHTGELPGDPFGEDPTAPENSYDPHYKVTIRYATDKEGGDSPGDRERDPNDPITFLERSINLGGEWLSVPPANTSTGVQGGGDALGQDLHTEVEDYAEAYFGDGTPNPKYFPGEPEVTATADPSLPIVKFIPNGQLSYKWTYVIRPPWRRIFRYLGTVNGRIRDLNGLPHPLATAIFNRAFYNLEPETIMFQGISANQKFLWNGSSVTAQPWEISYEFSVRRIEELGHVYGWNHIWDPRESYWKRLYRKAPPGSGGGVMDLYKQRNFLYLFQSGTDEDFAASF